MTEDEKDFLDEFVDEPAQADVPEPDVPEADEPKGPQRGPDGKFVKAEAAREADKAEKGAKDAVTEPVTVPDEPPSDGEEGQMVPVSVVKKLREELKAAKAGRTTEKSQPQAPQFDPQGEEIEDHIFSMKLNMSHQMANMQFGEGVVSEAWAAFDEAAQSDMQTSIMSLALRAHPHPLGEIVKWYQERQMLAPVREAGSLEAYMKRMLEQQSPQPKPASAAKPATPPSLAGRATTSSRPASADPFDELFNS